jgi:hypothetical protein
LPDEFNAAGLMVPVPSFPIPPFIEAVETGWCAEYMTKTKYEPPPQLMGAG